MPSLSYKPVSTVDWKGLTIKIENPAGSVREGIDKYGNKWSTEMPYDYGFIAGTKGIDGDEVDCFLGNDKSAKFVYVMHQLKKESGEFDEDKTFLGFQDAMDAKLAFKKSYDLPALFEGTLETIPFEDFKTKVLATKANPQMIHASKMNTAIALYAEAEVNPFTKGEPVTVNGLRGRGVVMEVMGDRVRVKFGSSLQVSRDWREVHKMSENTHSRMWRDNA